MKQSKNSLIRSESGEELHRRLLRISLWDSLNKDRKQPISFAFKSKASDVINRALSIEYLSRMKERGSY